MTWLNYHHLLYFWTVAKEGSIARACGLLHLTQPTISAQLRSLEKVLGAKLFDRAGRNLALTDTGRVVFQYADEIFSLGQELQAAMEGPAAAGPLRLVVGVAETLPELIVHRLLEPALNLPEPVRISCGQGSLDYLLAQLALNYLDVVLANAPAPPTTKIRAFNHLLGECGISFWGTPKLAAKYRQGFPRSLDGAPVLLPAENTVMRRSLEQWFAQEGIRPIIRGDFGEPGLLKLFGQHGVGVFAVRAVMERDTQRLYNVRLIGRVESIRERFYAITVDKKLKHPGVAAITAQAREKMFH